MDIIQIPTLDSGESESGYWWRMLLRQNERSFYYVIIYNVVCDVFAAHNGFAWKRLLQMRRWFAKSTSCCQESVRSSILVASASGFKWVQCEWLLSALLWMMECFLFTLSCFDASFLELRNLNNDEARDFICVYLSRLCMLLENICGL
jgi:hypothetical protein